MSSVAGAFFRGFRNSDPEQRGLSSVVEDNRRQLAPITPILLASALESDRHAMQELLKDTGYVLVHASTWNEALNLTGHCFFPIILYDRLFDIIDWQLAVRG